MKRKMKRITPEEAQQLLKSDGMDVTMEEAESILIFLRKLADIIVKKYLENGKNS